MPARPGPARSLMRPPSDSPPRRRERRANPDTPMPALLPAAPHPLPRPASPPPRFLVGRDPEGHWVAVEAQGRAGGLFRTCRDALHYAAGETGHRLGAVVLTGEPVALRL